MNKSNIKNLTAIALSGGVDSAVAAYLVSRGGQPAVGLFMRLGNPAEARAERAARAVAHRLDLPFYPVDLTAEFRAVVIEYFRRAYEQGLTPNPCAVCNPRIKFGVLLRTALAIGASRLATGHYARIFAARGRFRLGRAKWEEKDQSYFLAGLRPETLGQLAFPVGGLAKPAVRRLAERLRLPVQSSESQDICFLTRETGAEDHGDWLRRNLDLRPGPIIDERGRQIGRHGGLPLYTIGQRRGLEIGGTGPYYAARFDPVGNTLQVVSRADHPSLYALEFNLEGLNWHLDRPSATFRTMVVIRYRHPAVPARVTSLASGLARVVLDRPTRAVTPGQTAVFYQGDLVLASGFIAKVSQVDGI